MITFLDLIKRFIKFWTDFATSRSGRSMARALYGVLVFGTLYAIFKGKLTGTAAASVLIAEITGLGAAWVTGKLTPPTSGQ